MKTQTNNQTLFLAFSFLVLFSGCASQVKMEKAETEISVTTQEVLDQYGFPAKTQKYLKPPKAL